MRGLYKGVVRPRSFSNYRCTAPDSLSLQDVAYGELLSTPEPLRSADLFAEQLGIAAINASVFGCYKMAMTSMLGDDPALVPSLWQITCAGAASGIVTS